MAKDIRLIFGEAAELLGSFPKDASVWMTDTTANRRLAERLWSGAAVSPDQYTLFRARAADDANAVTGLIEEIVEHNPGWEQILIYGAPLTPLLGQIAQESLSIRLSASGNVIQCMKF